MLVAFTALVVFIAVRLLGRLIVQGSFRIDRLTIASSCLAAIGFLIPSLIALLTGRWMSFIELVIVLLVLSALISIVWKIFSIMHEQNSEE